LSEDLSNWVTYKQRTIGIVTSYGLRLHLDGIIEAPKTVNTHEGKRYLGDSTTPLSDDEYKKAMEEWNTFNTKEYQLRELINGSIPMSLYLRIKDKSTAFETWKELCSIMEKKSSMSVDNLQNQMAALRTPPGGDVRQTLSQLQLWYKELAGMGHTLAEDSYLNYIRKACGVTHNSEVIDTGASRHFSPVQSNFRNLVAIPPSPVTATDGRSFMVTARGD
ncbi:hypothetical protein EV360DRAFT_24062, partial [Lentinula raphanica]